jgi:hypothetical protein
LKNPRPGTEFPPNAGTLRITIPKEETCLDSTPPRQGLAEALFKLNLRSGPFFQKKISKKPGNGIYFPKSGLSIGFSKKLEPHPT